MAVVILYCRLCHVGYGSVGDLPVHCPSCGKPTRWGTSPPHSQKTVSALKFSRSDVQWMRTIGIDPEVP